MEETARALIATADATMARALRRVSVERGRDPRALVLVAFGGGGPLHACGLADALGMRRVFVPPWAGVLSALGLALAPERRDGLANVMRRADHLGAAELQGVRAGLLASLHDVGATGDSAVVERAWARVRYLGQGHELEVPLLPDDAPDTLATRFGTMHAERFGYELGQVAEIVSVRAALEGAWWPLSLSPSNPALGAAEHDPAGEGSRDAHVAGAMLGPCTVPLADATLRVADGWRARALEQGGWWLTKVEDA